MNSNQGITDDIKDTAKTAKKGAKKTAKGAKTAAKTAQKAIRGLAALTGLPLIIAGIIFFLIFFILLFFLSTPALFSNEVTQVNPYVNPDYNEDVEYTQEYFVQKETEVLTKMQAVFDSAYHSTYDEITTVCSSLGFDYERTIARLVDGALQGNLASLGGNEDGPSISPETNLSSHKESLIDIYAAYSVSIEQMTPKYQTDPQSGKVIKNENNQPVPLFRRFETDPEKAVGDMIKELTAFAQKDSKRFPYGNEIYGLDFVRDKNNNIITETIRESQPDRIVTDTFGNEVAIPQPDKVYVVAVPVIKPMDIGYIANNTFNVDMDAIYPDTNPEMTYADYAYMLKENYVAYVYGTEGGSFVGVPLSDIEVASWLNKVKSQYPNLGSARLATVQMALRTVGEIPYFLGGHPDIGGYASKEWGNYKRQDNVNSVHYNQMIPYGLDCASWYSWILHAAGITDHFVCQGTKYNSEKRLVCTNHTSTAKFAQANNSYPISASEILPGDAGLHIGGRMNHIGMYLCRDDAGRMVFVHCSGNGTVVVGNYSDFNRFHRINKEWADWDKLNQKPLSDFPQTIPYKQNLFQKIGNVIKDRQEV